VGEVWQTLTPEPVYGTSNWIQEHFIKGPEDYPAVEFYYRDAVYRDNLEVIREARRRLGEDGVVMVRVAKAPLQEMLYQLMGYEQFAVDYLEHRDRFDSLHATLAKRYTELYQLAAETPVEIVQLGDNVSSDVVGRERFRRYLMPEYARLRECLRAACKRLAVHMDGRLRALVDEIGAAELDIVEAITPPPMGDVSLEAARRHWPDKALWINFTSSVHLDPPEAIRAHTRDLLAQAGTRRGFAIGVTEDAPVAALERSLGAIASVLRETA